MTRSLRFNAAGMHQHDILELGYIFGAADGRAAELCSRANTLASCTKTGCRAVVEFQILCPHQRNKPDLGTFAIAPKTGRHV